jgi:hypothetical protein
MKNKTLSSTLLLAIGLVGCGGGGGGSAPDYTTKYVGTWKTECARTGLIEDATTQADAYSIDSYVFKRVSDTVMKAAVTSQVFASTDTSCSQASLGSIVYSGVGGNATVSQSATGITTGASQSMTIDGQTTINGKTVDKTSVTIEALTNYPVNTTITVGTGHRFTLRMADYQARSGKDLFYVDAGSMWVGDGSNVSATEYPTALDSTPFLKKQ